MSDTTSKRPIGAKKFVLLHHGRCHRDSFHYRIRSNAEIERLESDDLSTQHPNSIGIQLVGDFDKEPVPPLQLQALKDLLLDLKLRYPAVQIGAHRQVRGDRKTTCPGRRFPMRELREWADTHLLDERDDVLREVIESQYRP
ncbi:MAG: N-acetylmuramoyl-L-alanine amidase [Gammaproteobacteria bacterium]|nr:N-acetylmuramoyl-L-alanine amidase [Gammaproteobacteria bacterium]